MRQASKRIPESAEKTVRDIRRATRRHHSAEEKIRSIQARSHLGDAGIGARLYRALRVHGTAECVTLKCGNYSTVTKKRGGA